MDRDMHPRAHTHTYTDKAHMQTYANTQATHYESWHRVLFLKLW